MKKIISLLLAVLMIFSVMVVAFAGSYKEEAANEGVLVRCAVCDKCTGKFGCNCCAECPGYIDENGVATNSAQFLDCAFGSYYDVDIYKYDENGAIIKKDDGTYDLEHKGDYKMHYYWKALCCEECTGRKGCRCNNTDYENPCGCPCCLYEPDHTEEKIQEGLDKGKEGFTNGIQSALIAIRDVMYELFNKLFAFLRIDIILGKQPSETV